MHILTAKSMIISRKDEDHLFWLEEHLKRNYTLYLSLNQTSYLLIAQNHHHRVVTYFFRYVWLCLMYYCGCHSHFCFPSLCFSVMNKKTSSVVGDIFLRLAGPSTSFEQTVNQSCMGKAAIDTLMLD